MVGLQLRCLYALYVIILIGGGSPSLIVLQTICIFWNHKDQNNEFKKAHQKLCSGWFTINNKLITTYILHMNYYVLEGISVLSMVNIIIYILIYIHICIYWYNDIFDLYMYIFVLIYLHTHIFKFEFMYISI